MRGQFRITNTLADGSIWVWTGRGWSDKADAAKTFLARGRAYVELLKAREATEATDTAGLVIEDCYEAETA